MRHLLEVLTSQLTNQGAWTAALGQTILMLNSFWTSRAGETNPIQCDLCLLSEENCTWEYQEGNGS